MLSVVPFMTKGIVAFLIPTGLGVLAYALATLAAHLGSPPPRYIYTNRLICLVVLFVFICFLSPADAFTGTAERYFRSGLEAKGLGARYGMATWLIWLVLALLKYPKKRGDDQAA